MYTFLVFVAVLLVLVLAHEFGHFLIARLSGMRVYEFGFGFPPRAFSLAKIRGKWTWFGPRAHVELEIVQGTQYSFNWLPLGGFVRIKGENSADVGASDTDSFASKSFVKRVAVLVAGVAMNVLTAWVLISIVLMAGVPEPVSADKVDVTQNRFLQVLEVNKDGVAGQAGVLMGDEIVSIGAVDRPTGEQFRNYVQDHKNENLQLKIKRAGKELTIAVTPVYNETEKRALIGVAISDMVLKKYGVTGAFVEGAKTTQFFIKEIIFGLGKLIGSAFGGPKVDGEVAGPVGVAVMTGKAARMGWQYLLQFAAILSLNLAVLNVLPIPALDGGRLLFVIINAFKKRPVSPQLEQTIHSITFALLIFLVVLITVKDVGGLLPPIGTWLK